MKKLLAFSMLLAVSALVASSCGKSETHSFPDKQETVIKPKEMSSDNIVVFIADVEVPEVLYNPVVREEVVMNIAKGIKPEFRVLNKGPATYRS